MFLLGHFWIDSRHFVEFRAFNFIISLFLFTISFRYFISFSYFIFLTLPPSLLLHFLILFHPIPLHSFPFLLPFSAFPPCPSQPFHASTFKPSEGASEAATAPNPPPTLGGTLLGSFALNLDFGDSLGRGQSPRPARSGAGRFTG